MAISRGYNLACLGGNSQKQSRLHAQAPITAVLRDQPRVLNRQQWSKIEQVAAGQFVVHTHAECI